MTPTPWRFHLLTLPDRVWIDRDVPLQNASVTEAVSGPGAILGYLTLGYPNRDSVKEWGALLVAEQDGRPPVACIIDNVTTESGRLKVEAGGFSMYPTGMPWVDADYAGIQVDPLDIYRMIWAHLQSAPGGDLKVVVDTDTSSVRLGTPEDPKLTAAKSALATAVSAEASAKSTYTAAAKAKEVARVALLATAGRPASGLLLLSTSAPSGTRRSVKNLWLDTNNGNKGYIWTGKAWVAQTVSTQTAVNSALADYNTKTATATSANTAWSAKKKLLTAAKSAKSAINGGEAAPFTMTWWDTHDLGNVVGDLVKNTPFDYREVSAWDSSDNITHRIELAVPTLGGRRSDLRFEVGINVKAPPPLQQRDYASDVIVLGAGTGRAMVSATVTGNPGRVRRAVVVERKDLKKRDAAAAAGRVEVGKRSAVWIFNSLDVVDHELAPYGSFKPGDMMYVTGDAGWAQLDTWVRILELTTDCTTGNINLKVEAA
jgi:hypothetical protein